nr:MAG TPA: hypothetical protein [Caudoviricetes sp.]
MQQLVTKMNSKPLHTLDLTNSSFKALCKNIEKYFRDIFVTPSTPQRLWLCPIYNI